MWFLIATPATAKPGLKAQGAPSQQPNIVLVLTDDQTIDSLWAMPNVRATLARKGVTIRNAIISDPLCCPSRASILTGRFAGGHGVWGNFKPYAWRSFHDGGLEDHTVAKALQSAGYHTGLFGKYLNGYNLADGFVPKGWDRWFAFDEPNAKYYDYDIVELDADGQVHRRSFGSTSPEYSTSVIGRQAVWFIRHTPASQPLFLYAAVAAPHADSIPAPGDEGAFDGHEWVHSASFDEKNVGDKPRYIRRLPRLTPKQIAKYDLKRQRAAESLIGVDRLVGDLVTTLREEGRLSNTMFVFMSDNGLLLGTHRWGYKVVPYEESIRVPMIVRFDPLLRNTPREGSTSAALVANVDLAPTWASIANTSLDQPADGSSFRRLLAGGAGRRTDVLLESMRYVHPDGTVVPSYCGLRTRDRVYVRYATGEQELYRLDKDPLQLRNLARQHPPALRALKARTRELCVPVPPGFQW